MLLHFDHAGTVVETGDILQIKAITDEKRSTTELQKATTDEKRPTAELPKAIIDETRLVNDLLTHGIT